jgi:uncharacterized membrane-anchored protein
VDGVIGLHIDAAFQDVRDDFVTVWSSRWKAKYGRASMCNGRCQRNKRQGKRVPVFRDDQYDAGRLPELDMALATSEISLIAQRLLEIEVCVKLSNCSYDNVYLGSCIPLIPF